MKAILLVLCLVLSPYVQVFVFAECLALILILKVFQRRPIDNPAPSIYY